MFDYYLNQNMKINRKIKRSFDETSALKKEWLSIKYIALKESKYYHNLRLANFGVFR